MGCGSRCRFNVEYELEPGVSANWRDLHVNILIQSSSGERLIPFCSWVYEDNFGPLPARGRISCEVPSLSVRPGNYDLVVACELRGVLSDKLELPQFLVVTESDFFGVGRLPKPAFGQVYLDASWSLSEGTGVEPHTVPATETSREP